jgi:hypothetical protein
MKIETNQITDQFKPYTLTITIEDVQEHRALYDMSNYGTAAAGAVHNLVSFGSSLEQKEALMHLLWDAVDKINTF